MRPCARHFFFFCELNHSISLRNTVCRAPAVGSRGTTTKTVFPRHSSRTPAACLSLMWAGVPKLSHFSYSHLAYSEAKAALTSVGIWQEVIHNASLACLDHRLLRHLFNSDSREYVGVQRKLSFGNFCRRMRRAQGKSGGSVKWSGFFFFFLKCLQSVTTLGMAKRQRRLSCQLVIKDIFFVRLV